MPDISAIKVVKKEVKKDTVIVFKASRPLSKKEHDQLSEKVRSESEKSGVKAILMPYSCEISADVIDDVIDDVIENDSEISN